MLTNEQAIAQRLIGRVLDDKYRLRACIGIGGSGAVYRADQITLGRTVAVKILSEELTRDPRLVKRFQDEALAASRLNHPNTVSIIDYGQTGDGLLYLVMEHLHGPTLTHLIAKEHPLPPARVLGIVEQILAGVEEAHLAGVIHADLKSDNIIVEQRRTGADQVKVVDFGIARLVNSPREGEDRNICGTPEYMAPELISGQPPSVASDLYAIGVIAYELLTGQTPFVGGSSVDVLTRQLRQAPTPPSQLVTVAPEIDALVLTALSKRPGERFADAPTMRAAVTALTTPSTRTPSYACTACGAVAVVPFRFCPECGQPRKALAATAELEAAAATGAIVELTPTQSWPLGLVGRDGELDQVIDFLSGRLTAPALLLVGEPGSGRTALLRGAYERVAEAAGITIYQADADPSGLASPLYPLRALIATMLELPPVCGREQLVAAAESRGLSDRDEPGLSELFGNLTDLSELDAPVRRREMFASVARVLAAEARRGPTAVVFEDLDRYDRATIDTVRRLAERDASGVRIVVAMAASEANTWPTDCARVNLEALDGEALGFCATQLARGGATQLTAVQLAERTDGQPAHLEQLVRFLLEGGALEHAPTSLPDLIAARLSSLPRDPLVIVQAAAVFGREADLSVVAAAANLGDGFEAALTTVLDRGWLTAVGEVLTFPSFLIRDVVYGAMPATVRRGLHDFARANLGPMPTAALVAHHTDAAGLRADAARLYADAGDLAVRQLDDVGAARCYSQALACARAALVSGDLGPPELVAIAIRLAEMLRATGELALARGILHEAESWGDQGPRLQALLVRAIGQLVAAERDPSAAVPYLQRAIGAAIATGDGELIADSYLDLASVLIRLGKGAVAASELEEGLDMMTLGEGARTPRGPRNLWKVVLKRAQIAAADGDHAVAAEQAEIALAQAQRVASSVGVARSRSLLATAYEKLGNQMIAERHRRGAVDEMRRMGDRRGTAELLLFGTNPGRTLMRISADLLREARELAHEVGWTEGESRARTAAGEG